MGRSRHAWVALAVVGLTGATASGHGGSYRQPPGRPPPTTGVPAPVTLTGAPGWQSWWDLNRSGLLPGKDEAFKRRVITPGDAAGPTGKVAEPTPEERAKAWAEARAKAARDEVVPFLIRVLEGQGKNRDELTGAALIALAKIGPPEIAFPLLVRHLVAGPSGDKRATVVTESAALGLGLMRRTQPGHRMDGVEADRARHRLLDAFDDKDLPDSTRSFAALALGLLADQPYGSEDAKDGRVVTAALWERVGKTYAAADLPAALFTALSLQPRAGIPPETARGLEAIALGRPAFGRSWDSRERSHAITTALRTASEDDAQALLLASLKRPNEEDAVRRALFLAVGRRGQEMTAAHRREATAAVLDAMEGRRDTLASGLALLAAGRLLAAEIRGGNPDAALVKRVTDILPFEAREGSTIERGFATLGLALSAKEADPSSEYALAARKVVLDGLVKGKGDDPQRAAYAVAAGLLSIAPALEPLRRVVVDRGADPVLRGHAAIALGQIGRDAEPVREALLSLLGEDRGFTLRLQAATALAFLGRDLAQTRLLDELKNATTEWQRSHVVIALGMLGDLKAVPEILRLASDESASDLSRALAVAALGMLTDPEPRPSMHLLTEDANYPAGTPSLYSAFTIF